MNDLQNFFKNAIQSANFDQFFRPKTILYEQLTQSPTEQVSLENHSILWRCVGGDQLAFQEVWSFLGKEQLIPWTVQLRHFAGAEQLVLRAGQVRHFAGAEQLIPRAGQAKRFAGAEQLITWDDQVRSFAGSKQLFRW